MKTTGFTKKIAAILATAAMMLAAVSITASAEDNAFVISGDEFRSAYSTSGVDTIDYVTFKQAGNYELQFNFKLNSGITKTYTAMSSKLTDITAYIPLQDMLDKLKISADDISEITVSGASFDNVAKMSLDKTSVISVTSAASSTESASAASSDDRNPATGVEDVVMPLMIAGVSGTAVLVCGIIGTAKNKKRK